MATLLRFRRRINSFTCIFPVFPETSRQGPRLSGLFRHNMVEAETCVETEEDKLPLHNEEQKYKRELLKSHQIEFVGLKARGILSP